MKYQILPMRRRASISAQFHLVKEVLEKSVNDNHCIIVKLLTSKR